MNLIFMGDSITEGQYVDSSMCWPALVSAKLRPIAINLGLELNCHNRGISSETTRQALERYPRDVQGLRPDIMTLQFGLNDCNCWDTDNGLSRVSEAAYRANLLEMIDRARHFGAQYIILSTNHAILRSQVMTNGITLDENRQRYNHIVRDVALQAGVILCDIGKAFEVFSREKLAKLLLAEPDLLHLSKLGHITYADHIFPLLEKVLTQYAKLK
jgi:lysophospholipase L1-like esterase